MSDAIARTRSLDTTLRDYLELSKARIVMMVLITTAAGFVIARPAAIDLVLLLHTLIGTAFVAAGTNALNQYVERELDARMARTRRRPLPDGRMTERAALGFSVLISVFGVVYLAVVVNRTASFLALATLATYLFIYTPLKRKTTWCTLIGAAPGAIPPMVGWAGAAGSLDPGAGLLFAILFLWQMPHFFAIGWIYREDYAKAGFTMLSLRDDDGRASSRQAVFFAALLLPVSTVAPLLGIGGIGFVAGALAAGAAFVHAAMRFNRKRSNRNAKSLFMTSNLYLVVIMSLLVGATLM